MARNFRRISDHDIAFHLDRAEGGDGQGEKLSDGANAIKSYQRAITERGREGGKEEDFWEDVLRLVGFPIINGTSGEYIIDGATGEVTLLDTDPDHMPNQRRIKAAHEAGFRTTSEKEQGITVPDASPRSAKGIGLDLDKGSDAESVVRITDPEVLERLKLIEAGPKTTLRPDHFDRMAETVRTYQEVVAQLRREGGDEKSVDFWLDAERMVGKKTTAVIYGVGGTNRYMVNTDGEVTIDTMNSLAPTIERAHALGMRDDKQRGKGEFLPPPEERPVLEPDAAVNVTAKTAREARNNRPV